MVTLGVMLLYFPPILVAFNQRFILRYHNLLGFKLSIPIGLVLTVMMSYLLPSAWFVFVFYLALYHFAMFYIRVGSRFRITRPDAFSLSIYLVFAVSVLWEWPIQLNIPQNIDALILSVFKAVAIPLFFLKIYNIGFKLSVTWVWLVTGGITLGFLLMYALDNPLINLYRVVWAFLLLIAIPIMKKDIKNHDNKVSTL